MLEAKICHGATVLVTRSERFQEKKNQKISRFSEVVHCDVFGISSHDGQGPGRNRLILVRKASAGVYDHRRAQLPD